MSRFSGLVLTPFRSVRPTLMQGNKAFIHHVHSALVGQHESRLTLERFKQLLVDDSDCRMLLARCDLPQCYEPSDISQSDTSYRLPCFGQDRTQTHLAALYNFVLSTK